MATFIGRDFGEQINGSQEGDVIDGAGGNDTIWANAGPDSVSGGAGDDLIHSGEGDDVYDGGAGLDELDYSNVTSGLVVDAQAGTVVGNDNVGHDTFTGFERVYLSYYDDSLAGSAGADFFWGNQGNDTLNGGAGADTLIGGSGANLIHGGDGNDVLYGAGGDANGTDPYISNGYYAPGAEVYGDAGNDLVVISGYEKIADGGAGTDTLDLEMGPVAGDHFRVDLRITGAQQIVQGSDGTTVANFENVRTYYDPAEINGDDANNKLIGAYGADTLMGNGGDDSLTGAGGKDFVRGGEGDDSLSGGAEFDDLHGNQGNDTVAGGDGDDWVVGGKDNDSLTGDAGIDIVYGNLGDDTLDGGADRDIVRGGQGNDILAGGLGDDWMSGDRGDDTMSGGAGADTFHTFADAGIDRVTDFSFAEGDRVQLLPGATWTANQVGADVVVSTGPGAQLVLAGVSLSSMGEGWIFGA